MQSAKTQPFAPEPSSPDDLLETGLPNLWYLIARSEDVDVRPVALKRLDRNIVLWRGEKGEINVVEDYCPHRGAPLSMGEVINGNLACAYHGVQVTGAGIVADVPPTPNCPLVGQKAIRSYPCRELAGAIWAYFGDEAHAQAPEPIFPEEITSNEWTGFLITKTWQCNWQVALDNRADPVHGSFLHAGTFTLGRGRKDTELKIVPTPNGFETSRDNQRGVNIDWHEVFFRPENIFWVRTEIPYPELIGGGSFRIVGLPTPIDRDFDLFLGLPLSQIVRMAAQPLALPLQEPARTAVRRRARAGSRHARGHPAGGAAAGKAPAGRHRHRAPSSDGKGGSHPAVRSPKATRCGRIRMPRAGAGGRPDELGR